MNINVTTGGGSSQVAVGCSDVIQVQKPSMYDADLRRYVEFLFETHAVDIENSSVWEMAEQFLGFDLEDAELAHVFRLIETATVEVTVTW